MKKVLLLIFVVIGCNSTKTTIENATLCELDTTIKANEYYLVIDTLLKNKTFIKYGRIVISDTENIKNEIWSLSNGKIYTKKQINKQRNITKWLDYNPKGILTRVYYEYGNDVEIGKEFFFNEQGNSTQVIDHEKGYAICWKQAIEIVKKRIGNKYGNPKEDFIFLLKRTDLNEFPKKQPQWRIGIYREDVEPTPYYKVDGVTGKIVGKYKIDATWY